MEYRITKVNPTLHLETLTRLHKETLGDFPVYKFTKPETAWWLVTDTKTKEIVGFAGVARLPEPDRAHIYLCRSGVLPQARGKGLQKRLIQTRVKWAQQIPGVNFVITDTSPENIWSANNLIDMGFRFYRPGKFWASKSAVYLYLKIR